MKIASRDRADTAGLARFYNEQVVRVPHCYPVSPEEFEAGLHTRKEEDKHCKHLHADEALVSEEDGEILGFAHTAMGELEVNGQTIRGGLIRFLAYRPGHRAIGQALLTACEHHVRELGAERIWAFQKHAGYPFYHLGFGNLSDRLGHVYALLRMNGYDPDDGEIFLEQQDFVAAEPTPPDAAADIVVQEQVGSGTLPGLTVRALAGGKQIAACTCGSAGACCRAPQAQDTFFVRWLGVEPEHQGKGWGRYLLARAQCEMRRIGYRNAVISTDWRNHRALLFYTNYGFRVTDTVYGLVKHGQD